MLYVLAGLGLLFLCSGLSYSVAEDDTSDEEIRLQEQRSSEECSQHFDD